MCVPAIVPLAIMATSAAASAAQYAQQSQDANAAGKFQKQQYAGTASQAMQNYLRSIDSSNLRVQQETTAAGQAAGQNALAAQAAQATATTSAAEGGVQGNSVAQLLNDYARHEAMNNDTIYQNLQWEREQSNQDLLGYHAQAQGEISSAAPRPVHGPSPIGLGLSLAGTALQGYDSYQQVTRRGPYNPNNKGIF